MVIIPLKWYTYSFWGMYTTKNFCSKTNIWGNSMLITIKIQRIYSLIVNKITFIHLAMHNMQQIYRNHDQQLTAIKSSLN